ncbi:MAG: sodium:proton antiporter [Vicinamibacterales bacterium]
MSPFDAAAILVAAAALFGYVNHRLLRLPSTSGTLVIALASSLALLLADEIHPAWGLRDTLLGFVQVIDFNQTFMHGMLSFLLFAGALHVDLQHLIDHRWTIGLLATVGVLLSTAIVGFASWWVFRLVGLDVPLLACLVFGALISPTDPIAVMGLLKELRAPKALEAQIAGESLFNDGIGVVVFFALVSMAGFETVAQGHPLVADPGPLAAFFLREVGGGAVLGLGMGYLGYRALKSLDEHSLELLITLALVMFTYAVSFWIHVSGPIAVVLAGLFIGNPGRAFAMSDRTREHIDGFWSMSDEILNAVLFLLLGFEVVAVAAADPSVLAGLTAVPIVLAARFLSVSVPVTAMRLRGRVGQHLTPVLTWCGLRGGISVAMVLSLPPFQGRDHLITATYAVVVFSVLVQGLTVRRLLVYYGIGERTG